MRPAALALITAIALQTFPSANAQDSAAGANALYLAPSDGGVRRWEVAVVAVLRAGPSLGARSIGPVAQGDILSNLGCGYEDTALWCEVRPFRGGARGFLPASALAPAVGPDGSVAIGRDESERRAVRRSFDARGEVACAQERGQGMGLCEVGVARGTGGDATAVATFPNGFSRRLTFRHGEFVFADTTMSGTGTDIDWRLEASLHIMRVDDQRFEIPDALLFGE